MNKKIACLIACLWLVFFPMPNSFAQCSHKIAHISGTQTINGVQVTVTPAGHTGVITTYCPASTSPYLIGSNFAFPNMNGSFRFQFSPAIDSLTLNFSGINRTSPHQEIVKILINGSHYSIPSAGTSNGCEALAELTPNGNITGASSGLISGWNGTTITGVINEIIVLDSVATANPNGALFSLFICNEAVVLPMALSGFSAKPIMNAIQLDWTTFRESNADRFDIEHSLDGMNWEGIGSVKAFGNSNTELSYDFTHQSPRLGTNYYRLKQLDLNGEFEYSNITSVLTWASDLAPFEMIVKNKTAFIRNNSQELTELVIYSLNGQAVHRSTIAQYSNRELDLSILTAGIYFVIARNKEEVFSYKFVND